MKLTRLIKEGLIRLNRGLEVVNTELEEFNREQDARQPFRDVKGKAHEIQHVARIAEIVVPDDYDHTQSYINTVIEITNIVINLMNATIDNPKQRDFVLHMIKNIQEQEDELNNIYKMKDLMLEKMYALGLDQNASIADKIRFMLDQETEDEGLEIIIREELPRLKQAHIKAIELRTKLHKKGIPTY